MTAAVVTGEGQRHLVYLAGNRWDDVAGTDHQLVRALGRLMPVLWVDPPVPVTDRFRSGRAAAVSGLDDIAPGVRRMQVTGPPGPSRPGLRRLARAATSVALRSLVRSEGLEVAGVVVASAQATFPRLPGAAKMLFATDDWVVGAPLMGLSVTAVRQQLQRNLDAADVVAAVSPELADVLSEGSWAASVLANGVTPVGIADDDSREAAAGLLGQLNERIDLELLHAVADAGVRIRVIGPLTTRDPAAVARIESFLARPEVTWVGRVAPEELRSELGRVAVGLTPYADSAFNRASFPLKTLEYLGAGLPVVATDLPSARWLGCEDVMIATNTTDYVAAVREIVDKPFAPADAKARVAFADGHNWDARARQLLSLLQITPQRAAATADSVRAEVVVSIDSARTRRR